MSILKKTTVFVMSALVSATLLPSTASAQQSYVMTCRGGGDMSAVAGQRVSNPHVFVEITYKRAPAGAATRPPAPGECAWIDRGVHNDEPDKIMFKDMGVSWTQTICHAGGCSVRTPSAGATTLMSAVRDGRTFQVHVFNDGAGKMEVTKVGP